MNVFLLIEEYEQDSFFNKRKEPASPFSTIVGVYGDRNKAEKEKEMFEGQKDKGDQCSYMIEERPVL